MGVWSEIRNRFQHKGFEKDEKCAGFDSPAVHDLNRKFKNTDCPDYQRSETVSHIMICFLALNNSL